LGYPAYFTSEIGSDSLGSIIEKNLLSKNVTCDFFKHESKKTSLALAFLDDMGNAEYSFYKSHWQPTSNQRLGKEIRDGDLVLFSSLFSIHNNSHIWLCNEIDNLKNCKIKFIYDPNLRPGYLEGFEINNLRMKVENCMSRASLVKASVEDLTILWGELELKEYYQKVSVYCPYLILSLGAEGVVFSLPIW
jgi:sugar/nucleoside kinase (ribokinase family)